jgi:hypothetical protein
VSASTLQCRNGGTCSHLARWPWSVV